MATSNSVYGSSVAPLPPNSRLPPIQRLRDMSPRSKLDAVNAPSANTQLVPFVNEPVSGDYPAAASMNRSILLDVDERLSQLETRLQGSERANRILLDELARLQNELQNSVRRNEEISRDERQSKKMIESALVSYQDTISQLAGRITRAEEVLNEERRQLNELNGQAQTMEHLINSTKQDSNMNRDRSQARVNALEEALNEINRNQQKYERSALELVDELRLLKTNLETQGLDLETMANEVKSRTKRLEDDYHHGLESLKRQVDRQSAPINTSHQVRNILDQRLNDIMTVMNHLRQKQEDELTERRSLEALFHTRIAELSRSISDIVRQREEISMKMESNTKERNHRIQTEKQRMEQSLSQIVDTVDSKLLEQEIRLREAQSQKIDELEKLIQQEQDSRRASEKELKQENERRWQNLQRQQGDENLSSSDVRKKELEKFQDGLQKLNEALDILDKEIVTVRKEMDSVIGAEIKARTAKDRHYEEKLNDLGKQVTVATSALQTSVNTLSQQMSNEEKQAEKVIGELLEKYRGEVMSRLNDMDRRLLGMNTQMNTVDETLNNRFTSTTEEMNESVKKQLETIYAWQKGLDGSMTEIRTESASVKNGIDGLKEGMELLRSEMNTRVFTEKEARVEAVEALRREVIALRESLPDKEQLAYKSDLLNTQTSIRKLAESMQTMKTVLSMKLQSEQKLRVEELKTLHDELTQVRDLLNSLLRDRENSRLFVKPKEMPEEEGGKVLNINKWNMYTANRWINYKSRLMYLRWRAKHSSRSIPPVAGSTKPQSTPVNDPDTL